MREIKFRAWDGDNMIHHVRVGNNMVTQEGVVLWHEIKKRKLDDSDVMQFTGLKDKNNVDIYESDLVKCKRINKEWTGEVKISPTQGVIVGLDPIWPHNCEVIGNIWEDRKEVKTGGTSESLATDI